MANQLKDGRCSSDIIVKCARLVAPVDRRTAGRTSRDGLAVRSAGIGRVKTSHFARRECLAADGRWGFKTSHFATTAGKRRCSGPSWPIRAASKPAKMHTGILPARNLNPDALGTRKSLRSVAGVDRPRRWRPISEPADPSGSGRRAGLHLQLLTRAAVCQAVQAKPRPLPFRRMECRAGRRSPSRLRQRRADRQAEGKRRKTDVFRDRAVVTAARRTARWSCGRRPTTSSAAWRTPSRTSAACRRRLVIDNLRAAVSHRRLVRSRAESKCVLSPQHYGTVILPTKALHAAAQGEDRTGHRLRQGQRLKGRTSPALEEQNQHPARLGTQCRRLRGFTARRERQVGSVSRSSNARLAAAAGRSASRSSRKRSGR